jgi:hypothetical protein
VLDGRNGLLGSLLYQEHVKEYVSHCLSCLLNKPPKFSLTGKLQPIRPAANPWDLVTIRETAPVHALAWQIEVADLRQYLDHHRQADAASQVRSRGEGLVGKGVGRSVLFRSLSDAGGTDCAIITDRGCVFVSYFWTTLVEMLGTDCVATTAYNPEADGQNERTNQTIEIALRHVVNGREDDWADFLGEIQQCVQVLMVTFMARVKGVVTVCQCERPAPTVKRVNVSPFCEIICSVGSQRGCTLCHCVFD